MTPGPNDLLRRILLVVASPIEAEAALEGLGGGSVPAAWLPLAINERLDLLVTGIGKANAAGAVASALASSQHTLVLNVGIAGSLGGPGIGDVLIGSGATFADEGLQTPTDFLDCAAMGFPLAGFPGSTVPVSDQAVRWLTEVLTDLHPTVAPIATVSTCSGTSALATAVKHRTEAAAEAMEGAAAALVAHRLGVPFAEVRVISNTTGDRPSQTWDIKQALSKLSRVIGILAQAVRGQG